MREADILAAVRAGQHEPLEWARLDLSPTVAIEVTCDALSIGGTRRAMNARTTQHVADLLDCALWTPEIDDRVARFAEVRIQPQSQAPLDPAPKSHACPRCKTVTHDPWPLCFECGEREHSAMIESAVMAAMRANRVAPTTRSPLLYPTGKHWVLSRYQWEPWPEDGKTHQVWIYGWRCLPSKSGDHGRLIQPLSCAHNLDHVDYSSLARFWRPCAPSGCAVDWAPALAVLGLPDRRIPGVSRA
jgi:hypothetical protein